MAKRALRIILFTTGTLTLVAGSMVAGAVIFIRNSDVLSKTLGLASTASAPTLLEKAQRRFGQKIYSQWNEETLIRHFFNDQRDGFFVDVGAGDCCTESTTYYLASRLGWTGISIDANASVGPEYAVKRKGTKFLSFFVSDTSDEMADYFFVPQVPGISSGDPTHAKKFDFVAKKNLAIEEQKIRTVTLNKVLEANQVARIDFLSMDIEGAELAALNGFDIEKYKPRLVCVEIQQELGAPILQYFVRHGYQRVEDYLPFDRYNWYFTPAPHAKRSTAPVGG